MISTGTAMQCILKSRSKYGRSILTLVISDSYLVHPQNVFSGLQKHQLRRRRNWPILVI